MESKDLLHPELDENQNLEVNAGTSDEVQNHANDNECNPAENAEEPIETIETAATEEPKAAAAPIETEQPVEPAEMQIPVEEPAQEPVETPAIPTEEPAASVEDMVAEIENANAQEPEEASDEASEEQDEAASIEKIEAEYAEMDFPKLVEELQNVLNNMSYTEGKPRVGILKSKILDCIKKAKQAELAAFIEAGGNKEEFVHTPDELENQFNAAMKLFKENKDKFIEKLEAEKQHNLETKQSIIEGLKNLIENESDLKILNDKFKEYQAQWKAVGPVPQNESTNLWQNYHYYMEKFFDIIRINKELRSLDLKKNLEQKIKLCETAESLLLDDSINKSFKVLQQLHNEWKEIGPVMEDKKEEIWERFKNASDQINQRRREHYEKLYAEQQNNYNAKVVLCEQAEELVASEPKNIKESNAVSEKLTELLKVWKTLGPAPAKLNDEIWERFKSTLNKFFQAKKEYFQQLKDTQMQNYNQKLNLAIQAEAIALRTDWKKATEEILALQKEWKEIGPVPRKHSETVWKRFRSACDKFFENKSHYFANIQDIEQENLQKKEDLIKRILECEFGEDRNANMDVMKAFQREWTELGHVPRKDKDRIYAAYREAVNKRFADMKVSAEEFKRDSFKNKIDNILSNPDADRLLDKEKRFLSNKLTQLKEDVALWENNLGFFANSKNADLLKEEFVKKIEAAKREIKDLEYKVKMMSSKKEKEE